jgi:hypothetical protein
MKSYRVKIGNQCDGYSGLQIRAFDAGHARDLIEELMPRENVGVQGPLEVLKNGRWVKVRSKAQP